MATKTTHYDLHASYLKALRDYVESEGVLKRHARYGTVATAAQRQMADDARVIFASVRRRYLATLRVRANSN